MRIAVSGYSGCGNTTVSRLLSERLGAKLVNFTFRDLAAEKGLDFEEIRALAEKSPEYDLELDRRQVEMAEAADPCVLASRLAAWMLKTADFRFFLDVSQEERARRVHRREGGAYDYWLEHTRKRDDTDTARYKAIYGIDNRRIPENFIVIRGDGISPDDTVSLMLGKIKG